jgi:hypothetical protein
MIERQIQRRGTKVGALAARPTVYLQEPGRRHEKFLRRRVLLLPPER